MRYVLGVLMCLLASGAVAYIEPETGCHAPLEWGEARGVTAFESPALPVPTAPVAFSRIPEPAEHRRAIRLVVLFVAGDGTVRLVGDQCQVLTLMYRTAER